MNLVRRKVMSEAYHHGLQALTNPPFSLSAFFDLLPQHSRLFSVAAHLALGLLAPEHGTLQRGVCRFPF